MATRDDKANGVVGTEDDTPNTIDWEKGPDREEMANAFMPGDDEWDAKSLLDINDPGRIALLSIYSDVVPGMNPLQPVLDEFVEEFLKSRTSVDGLSREEIKGILQSMYGKSPDEQGGGVGVLLNGLGVDDED